MNQNRQSYGDLWERVNDLCSVLRGPHGCAWDKAQSSRALTPYLLEEVHELIEALELGSSEQLSEETGDAIYLWVFFLQALEAEGRIVLEESVSKIEEKLTRRHPHVFGSDTADTGRDARGHWEQQKREEKGSDREILRRLPAALPALAKAHRLQGRAAGFGFDWNSPKDVVEKIREEIDELITAVERDPTSPEVKEELGDLLFAVVNLARHLDQNPEETLAIATEKFRNRFNSMARAVEGAGHKLGETPLDVLESHWQAVKKTPASKTPPSDQG